LRSGSLPRALRQLARNSMIEIALGLAIFAIVGALGTMHPAIHFGG
jgi:copper resistance protein D